MGHPILKHSGEWCLRGGSTPLTQAKAAVQEGSVGCCSPRSTHTCSWTDLAGTLPPPSIWPLRIRTLQIASQTLPRPQNWPRRCIRSDAEICRGGVSTVTVVCEARAETPPGPSGLSEQTYFMVLSRKDSRFCWVSRREWTRPFSCPAAGTTA